MLTGTHRREFISLQVWDPKRSPPGSVVQRSPREAEVFRDLSWGREAF